MLGSSSAKAHINSSQSVEVKPRLFLEFNGNDIADPYFYGTGGTPDSSYESLKRTISGSPSVSNVDSRGVATALSGNATKAELINVSANRNTYTYYIESPSGVKSVKFNMFLKSDYKYQVSQGNDTYLESFDVVCVAQGIDVSGKVVKSEVVTKSFNVNSVDWTEATVAFANPDDEGDIDKVRLNINIHPPSGYNIGLLVSQPIYAEVSPYEVFVENRLPVGEVFETNRPGEFMIDMAQASRPTVDIVGTAYNQKCSPVHMSMSYVLGSKYDDLQRSVMPFEGNPYSYYVSGSTSIPLESQYLWALYKNNFKSNKIVIKVNNIAYTPNSFTIKVLTSAGWSSSIVSSEQFDDNGILCLYYNGSTWSTTKWSDNAYPEIRDTDGQIVIGSSTGYVEIHGIYFQTDSLQVTNPDFQPGAAASLLRLEMVEISPRLELDVTEYLESFDIVKETDNESNILPIGGISSNSAKITLSNILITKTAPDTLVPSDTDPDIPPFSNFSPLSPIRNMLKKGVKIRGGFQLNNSLTNPGGTINEYIPAFVMYVDEWKDNDFSISISAFDVVKNLQTLPSRPLYLRSSKITEIITAVLDSVGFGDYYFDDLRSLRLLAKKVENELTFSINETIGHFWSSKDTSVAEVLQDIFKVYQIAMYTDEYGAVRFTSLYSYSDYYKQLTDDTPSKNVDVYVQDKTDSNGLSNLEAAAFVENERPQSIIIKYKIPQQTLNQPKTNTDAGKNQSLKTTRKPGTDIAWVLQETDAALPYFEIVGEGIRGIAQDYIPYSPAQQSSIFRYIPYSSLLLIDEEIVSYDGKEYEFSYQTSVGGTIYKKKIVVKSQQDLDLIVRNIMTNNSAINITYGESGKLMNVKRGLYGTTPSRHTKSYNSGNAKWRARSFTRSGGGYVNGQSISIGSREFSNTAYGIQLTCKDNDKLILLTPKEDDDDNYKLKNKRRLSAVFNIKDIPDAEAGYLGVGMGIQVDGSNNMQSGLIVWFGKLPNKKKKEPVVFVEQIVNGDRKTLVAKDEFEYSDRLFDEGENLEITMALNDKRDKCKILIGGTSAFAKEVEVKEDKKDDPEKEPTKEYKDFPVVLKSPLGKNSTFGVVASHFASGIVGQFMFGVSRDPQDMNDLDISNLKDDYSNYKKKRATYTYFIGDNSLLETIVNKQLVPGFNDAAADNFVYTANPVARGMKVFEIEYDTFPVIEDPKVQFLGYSYDINSWQDAALFTNKYVSSGDK